MWQFGQNVPSVMVDDFMMEELKIIESSTDCTVICLASRFFGFNPVQLVAHKDSLLDEFGALNLNRSTLQEGLVVSVYDALDIVMGGWLIVVGTARVYSGGGGFLEI